MWLDSHRIVIVPVNAKETPITRWRTEIISPEIYDLWLYHDGLGALLHKKELVFRNENRPVPRFLYFRFVMALIRIKDLQRPDGRMSGPMESWIAHHGFDSPLQLTDAEAVEAARRAHMVVVEAAERAERVGIYENRDSESESESEESEDESEESESESESESEESEDESEESETDSEEE
ncbi:hypothetical protein ACQKWADRAFT_315651 [Trichoderma austrokoningii]